MSKKVRDIVFESEILWLTLAVYLGSVFEQFFRAITKDILLPFLNSLTGLESEVATYKTTWRGQTIYYGDALFQLLNVLIALLITVIFLYGLHNILVSV